MELVLDRKIAQSYVYPAVDIFKSGTRREELLLPPHQLEKINLIRRGLAGHKPVEAVERLLHFVRRHPTNAPRKSKPDRAARHPCARLLQAPPTSSRHRSAASRSPR